MKKASDLRCFFLSGRKDSNLRPPGPKPGALAGLRYAPNSLLYFAVRGGFEPPVPFPVRQFSKLLVSATHPPHQTGVQKYERIVNYQIYFKKIMTFFKKNIASACCQPIRAIIIYTNGF